MPTGHLQPKLRPAYEVDDVAFMRHLIFRDIVSNRLDIDEINDRRLRAIGELINSIDRRVRDCNIAHESPERRVSVGTYTEKINPFNQKYIEGSDSYTIYICNFTPFKVRMRIDCHQEYVTITFILDCSAKDIMSSSIGFDKCFCKVFFDLSDGVAYGGLGEEAGGYHFAGLWDEFDSLIGFEPENRIRFLHSLEDGRTRRDEIVGDYVNLKSSDGVRQRIVEFRGLSVSIANRSLLSNGVRDISGDAIIRKFDTSAYRQPYTRNLSRIKKYIEERRDYFSNFFVGDLVNDMAVRRDKNSIMCSMLDGLAIYGSSLGSPLVEIPLYPPSGSQAGRDLILAVNYFVVFDTSRADQRGRLIRLLHVLGELRTAALFDQGEIREAGIQLRQLGSLWDSRDSSDAANSLKWIVEDEYRREINRNRFNFIGRLGAGDLSYRLGRSSFYAQNFRARVDDLRSSRIEGYQEYSDFMRRNVAIIFDKNNSIFTRYASAQRAMEYIDNRTQTIRAEINGGMIMFVTIIAALFALYPIILSKVVINSLAFRANWLVDDMEMVLFFLYLVVFLFLIAKSSAFQLYRRLTEQGVRRRVRLRAVRDWRATERRLYAHFERERRESS